MSSETEAKAALAELDGYSVKGNHIHVEVHQIFCIYLLAVDKPMMTGFK